MDISNEKLLKPGEVARLLRVDPKTVSRWANDGRIPSLKTPGNQRRFRERDILAIIKEPDPE
jgi:excisionase family DNA binding protein